MYICGQTEGLTVGLKAGMNSSRLKDWYYEDDPGEAYEMRNETGFHAGMFITRKVFSLFAVQSELLFTRRGYGEYSPYGRGAHIGTRTKWEQDTIL